MKKATIDRACYSALGLAEHFGFSKATVYRALRNDGSQPDVFPPPLEYMGRKGTDGDYIITHDQAVAWIKSMSRFG